MRGHKQIWKRECKWKISCKGAHTDHYRQETPPLSDATPHSLAQNGKLIDFDIEPRFIQSSDKSLTITKTTELDSGQYTASLIVQDVPNPPSLLWVKCDAEHATVTWNPMGDNRAPILNYKILYNTSFTPDTWEVATDVVPASDTSYAVDMSPWTNYTFKVIARNQVGDSFPSGHSETCLTPENIPFKNPDNVEGRGTSPNNLVIYWT
ncbi:Uncharacterized protein FKW44_018669, partial [Caligus rogercresseyi]